MSDAVSVITIMFDEPSWVGIYERQFGNKYDTALQNHHQYNFHILI